MPDNLAAEVVAALLSQRLEVPQRYATITCSDQTWRSTACTFVTKGLKSSVKHSDERRQRVMEALGVDVESRMRMFLDKNGTSSQVVSAERCLSRCGLPHKPWRASFLV